MDTTINERDMGTGDSPIWEELKPGEQLLWSGRPITGAILQESDLRHIPFSLAWLGFSIFWVSCVLSSEPPFNIFAVFGIPFVLLGVYMVIGRFFVDAKRRRHTWYGVTDRRIIILTEVMDKKVGSIDFDEKMILSFKLKKDGTGFIRFGDFSAPYPFSTATPNPLSFFRIVTAFEGIPDAQEVHDLISRLIAEKRADRK